MNNQSTNFSLEGRVALVTGGTGALGSVMAAGLAAAGARVAVMGRNSERAVEVSNRIGPAAMPISADVLNLEQLEAARKQIIDRHGRLDILVNAAGGNLPGATLAPDGSFFDIDPTALREVVDINYMGTVLPIRIFGRELARSKAGSIINISSMAAIKSISRVVGYSAAKAAIDNLTRWLAMDFGREYQGALRVNAIAPGFFVGEQNRRLLLEEDGSLTNRGQTIIAHTPMGRFGEAEELTGTLLWLASDASRFVTGVVVPVDGGFSSSSGV